MPDDIPPDLATALSDRYEPRRLLGRGGTANVLPGRRPQASASGRAQGAPAGPHRLPRRRTVSQRDPDRRPPHAPPHSGPVRLGGGGWVPALRHALRGRRIAAARAGRRAPTGAGAGLGGRFLEAPAAHRWRLGDGGSGAEAALVRGLPLRPDQRTATPAALIAELSGAPGAGGAGGAPRRRYAENEVQDIVKRATE